MQTNPVNPVYVSLRRAGSLRLLQRIAEGQCCAVVGVSNTGKSGLLRGLSHPEWAAPLQAGQPDGSFYVYVDFNRMLETTEQGFYELILRCLTEGLPPELPAGELLANLQAAYETLVAPPSSIQVPLAFSEGLANVCRDLPGQLVLLFDEFDEPFERIAGRAFLILRALRDQYGERLSLVTATNAPLATIRRGRDVDEFVELFEPFTFYLGLLDARDSSQVMVWVADQEGYTFDESDKVFVAERACGHLGLTLAVSRVLGQVTGKPVRDAGQNWLIHRQVQAQLEQDVHVQAECRKLWDDLTEEQQVTLMALVGENEEIDPVALDALRQMGLVCQDEERVFSPLFEGFIQRQRLIRPQREEGVRLDVESGRVWVSGQEVAELTDLEYRLLLLLYGHLNEICTKDQIADAVWGQNYLEAMDDARIDKLVSRLRARIEPDPTRPRYLITVRRRGYKLVTL
jgi:hypothetical protein